MVILTLTPPRNSVSRTSAPLAKNNTSEPIASAALRNRSGPRSEIQLIFGSSALWIAGNTVGSIGIDFNPSTSVQIAKSTRLTKSDVKSVESTPIESVRANPLTSVAAV